MANKKQLSKNEWSTEELESLELYYAELLTIMYIALAVISINSNWCTMLTFMWVLVMFFLSWLSKKVWISVVLFVFTIIFSFIFQRLIGDGFTVRWAIIVFSVIAIFWYIFWGSLWVTVRGLYKLIVKKEKLSKKEIVEVCVSWVIFLVFLLIFLSNVWVIYLGNTLGSLL